MSRTKSIYDPISTALNLPPIEFDYSARGLQESLSSSLDQGVSGFEGRIHTEESKQKISKALKGRRNHFFVNPEAQRKHAESMKTNNPMLGRKHSEETKMKMRETKKRRDLIRASNRQHALVDDATYHLCSHS
jgi:hypothetical protein